jgi:pseudaminic acid cytidylyltransferase
MNICVIPARGGSKRIPGKNIKQFHGKPIIAWSIEAALESQCFDRIVCSTDSEDIAKVARQYGAETPFLRPEIISDDHVTIAPVIAHSIEFYEKEVGAIDFVCCIFATAPFIQSFDIQKSLEIIKTKNIDYCFSATSYSFPIQRSIFINKDGRCKMFQPETYDKRSQDLEDMYHDAGQFYWGKASSWLENKNIFSEQSIPYLLPRYQVQDIDTEEDWIRAELMYSAFIDKLKNK